MVVKGGPGPNVYRLPTTVGYKQHDNTKHKKPAFTIGNNFPYQKPGLGPGLYDLCSKTRYGPVKGPAFTFSNYHADYTLKHKSPGPIVYAHPGVRKQNPPKYTMGLRTEEKLFKYSPAPNSYSLPPTIGPKIPNKPTVGAFTMGVRRKEIKSEGVPAPNKYDGRTNLNSIKSKMPKYTMASRIWPPDAKKPYPAPNRYYVKPPPKPGFTFGIRPGSAKYTIFTVDDVNTPTIHKHKN